MEPRIPLDILDHILQFDLDFGDLAVFARLCKSWHTFGTRNLYRRRRLIIWAQDRRWLNLHIRFVEDRPDHAVYVQTLALEAAVRGGTPTISIHVVYTALFCLPNVQTLRLTGFCWDTDAEYTQLPILPHLRNLYVSGLTSSSDSDKHQPLQVLSLASRWNHVELLDVHDNRTKIPLELPNSVPIDTLVFRNPKLPPVPAVTKFLPAISGLRILEIDEYVAEDFEGTRRVILANDTTLRRLVVKVSATDSSLDNETRTASTSMGFVSGASALNRLVVDLPLYSISELDARDSTFQPVWTSTLLCDVLTHLPASLSVLELRFSTCCGDMDEEEDHDLDARMQMDWRSAAAKLNAHREIQCVKITLQGRYCRRKQPSWTPMLSHRVTPHLTSFDVYHCSFNNLVFYRTRRDAELLRLHFPV